MDEGWSSIATKPTESHNVNKENIQLKNKQTSKQTVKTKTATKASPAGWHQGD